MPVPRVRHRPGDYPGRSTRAAAPRAGAGFLNAQADRWRNNQIRPTMNRLYNNLAILRRGNPRNNQAPIAMFNKFQAKPLRKATRYDSIASKIAPDIQPPIA